MKKRVLFVSSGGGHLTELLKLDSCFKKYDYHLITEKNKATTFLKDKYPNKVKRLFYPDYISKNVSQIKSFLHSKDTTTLLRKDLHLCVPILAFVRRKIHCQY